MQRVRSGECSFIIPVSPNGDVSDHKTFIYSHIVDMEDLTERKSALRPAYVSDFYGWFLHGPDGWRCKDVDPMVACMEYAQIMPDEEELRRVANVTMEKGLDVVKNFRSRYKMKPLVI